jgi:hypothetical protein
MPQTHNGLIFSSLEVKRSVIEVYMKISICRFAVKLILELDCPLSKVRNADICISHSAIRRSSVSLPSCSSFFFAMSF